MKVLTLIDLRFQTIPFLVSYKVALDSCPHNNVLCVGLDRGSVSVQPSSLSISTPPPSQLARMPSPVRNLTAAVNFDVTKSKIIANLSWIGPESPYGKIDYYKIVLSSPRAASLIGLTTLDVKVCNDINLAELRKSPITQDILFNVLVVVCT